MIDDLGNSSVQERPKGLYTHHTIAKALAGLIVAAQYLL